MNKLIRELEDIRVRLTQIYMRLGNPNYLRADSVLNEDIFKITEDNANANQEEEKGKYELFGLSIALIGVSIGVIL